MRQIYGIHAVQAVLTQPALQAREVQQLYLAAGKLNARLQRILALAEAKHISVARLSYKALEQKAAGHKHQGVMIELIGSASTLTTPDLSSLLTQLTKPALLLILDTVQDPHNLGACLRTANAAGVDAVIIPKDKSASVTPVVSKVACGADQTTPIITVTNLARTMEQLKEQGVWLLGAAGEANAQLYQTDFTGSVALVLGNEADGLRRLTRDKCDQLFAIPMFGTVESLNVSVATGVCLYEVVRQRNILP